MLAIFIVLVILSAFFSSLETALFHLKSYSGVNKTVKDLLENPKQLLASLLTGNTIVNIGLASIAASYTLILYNNKFLDWEIEANGMFEIGNMTKKEAIKYIKENAMSLMLDDEKYWVIKVNGILI